MKITKSHQIPQGSIIASELDGQVDYVDAFSVLLSDAKDYSVDYLAMRLFSSFPGWVRLLLSLRNMLMKPFGLAGGEIPKVEAIDEAVRVEKGDRVVLFSVHERNDSEIVMAENDKHLYFRASVLIELDEATGRVRIHVTTLVQFHNAWGRLYFTPVKPFHKLIVGSQLKRFALNLQAK